MFEYICICVYIFRGPIYFSHGAPEISGPALAYTPQQNGVVERKHRHLLETAGALKLHASLPTQFWGDCILAATYLINKMPMPNLNWKYPFEMLYDKPPSYANLKTIGCLCFADVTKPHKDKFESRAIWCVLIGYPSAINCLAFKPRKYS